jgi:hypothetical protein
MILLKVTIDEVCIDSQKKMAVCVDSILVGLAFPFPVTIFWPSRNDEILVHAHSYSNILTL